MGRVLLGLWGLFCGLSGLGANGGQYAPALGVGINFSETKTFGTCLNYTETEPKALAMVRDYHEMRVRDRDEMNHSLGISVSVSAKGFFGSFDASVSHFKEVQMSNESFYWLVDAKYELSLERIRTNAADFGLTDRAKQILREGGLPAFYKACGTHFYIGRKLGARYSLLYEFTSHDDRSVENLKAKASYAGYGVKAKVELEQSLKRARSHNQVNVYTHIVGGDSRVKDYAYEPSLLDGELQKLRDQLYDEKKGVPIEWYVSSYDLFPEILKAKHDAGIEHEPSDERRTEALILYYRLYTKNTAEMASIRRTLLRASGDEPFVLYSEAKVRAMNDVLTTLDKQNQHLEVVAANCLEGFSECPLSGIDVAPLTYSIPEADRDLSTLGTWSLFPIATKPSRVFIDLSGRPEGNFTRRVFNTFESLYETRDGGVIAVVDDGRGHLDSVQIGDFTRVQDRRTGRWVPNLCVDQKANLCNLRVIENPRLPMDDGYPLTRLQLSVFDEYGFIIEKMDYPIKQ